MKYIICLISLIYTIQLQGQDLYIQGVVVDTTGVSLEHVHVLNQNTQKGTISNKEGYFKLSVNINDTLVLSSVQHIKILKIVKVIDLENDITIVLTKIHQQLPDLILSPQSPFLDTSAVVPSEITLSLPFDNTIINRSYTERQYDVLKPKVKFSGIGISASVLGSLTKEYKNLGKLKDLKKEEDLTNNLYHCFSERFYEKTLGISQSKSALFIDYCLKQEPNLTQLVEQKDVYTLIERLQHLAIGFNAQFKK